MLHLQDEKLGSFSRQRISALKIKQPGHRHIRPCYPRRESVIFPLVRQEERLSKWKKVKAPYIMRGKLIFKKIEVEDNPMELRNLTFDDFDASVDLSQYAFQYSVTAEQREERRSRFKPEQVWGIFDHDKLEAQLTVIPLQLYIQGRVFEMGGIAGVSSWPEHRRRGNVALLDPACAPSDERRVGVSPVWLRSHLASTGNMAGRRIPIIKNTPLRLRFFRSVFRWREE